MPQSRYGDFFNNIRHNRTLGSAPGFGVFQRDSPIGNAPQANRRLYFLRGFAPNPNSSEGQREIQEPVSVKKDSSGFPVAPKPLLSLA